MNNILHIGFSKCASSWLQSVFKSLNDSFFYIEKSHFFSPLYINKYKKYSDYFVNAKENQICIESDEHIILPDYCNELNTHGTKLESVDKVFKKIKNEISETKIILVIRNHKSLIVSRYSQYIVSGGNYKFDRFFNIINGKEISMDYFQNYYGKIIQSLYNIFKKENVHIILQEELFTNKEIEFSKLMDFIGSQTRVYSMNIFNQRKGLSIFGLMVLRWINSFIVIEKESIKNPIKTLIPRFIYSYFLVRLIRLIDFYFFRLRKFNAINLINSSHNKYLSKKFKEDNYLLSKILNKPLDNLGYII